MISMSLITSTAVSDRRRRSSVLLKTTTTSATVGQAIKESAITNRSPAVPPRLLDKDPREKGFQHPCWDQSDRPIPRGPAPYPSSHRPSSRHPSQEIQRSPLPIEVFDRDSVFPSDPYFFFLLEHIIDGQRGGGGKP